MRFIHFGVPFQPSSRWESLAQKRLSELLSRGTHKERGEYLAKHPSWGRLKFWLSEFSNNKCWYCEAKTLRAPTDVDHFRPKLGTTVDGVVVAQEGYYWLAYAWWNFRLSCQRCNRPENDELDILRGKRNEFPLRDETPRCSAPTHSHMDEEPRFLDPCNDEDVKLLAYGVDGEVKPVAAEGTWEHERARYTIATLGLNSYNVAEYRRERWLTLLALINLVGDGPVSDEVETRLRIHISPKHEYSSFFRSVVGTYRDKAWIEALL